MVEDHESPDFKMLNSLFNELQGTPTVRRDALDVIGNWAMELFRHTNIGRFSPFTLAVFLFI
jgi:hypothetical protein